LVIFLTRPRVMRNAVVIQSSHFAFRISHFAFSPPSRLQCQINPFAEEASMKAMILKAPGGPDMLELADLPRPVPGPNQLLVRIHAAAINPIDYKLRQTGAMGVSAGSILGFDAAGTVEALGPGVTGFKPGDEVFYSPGFGGGDTGTYAEFGLVAAHICAPKPVNLSFAEAAAVPLAGQTALGMVYTRGHVRVGQTVCVSAANGGVGSLAVQNCKAAGAHVFATCSTRSAEFVESLGAVDRLIDYQREDWTQIIRDEAPAGLDLLADCAGHDYVSQAIKLMKQPTGQIVTIVNPTGQLAEPYRNNITIHYEFLQRSRPALDLLSTLIERGQIDIRIDHTLPLDQVATAHRQLEAGGVKGKIVLEIA
jgi:NADPH2:quinone reductase